MGPKGSEACLSIFIRADNPLKFELFALLPVDRGSSFERGPGSKLDGIEKGGELSSPFEFFFVFFSFFLSLSVSFEGEEKEDETC